MNHKIIKLGEEHLKSCLDLDQKALKGLWSKSQWERELTDDNRICLGVLELETNRLLAFCSAWFVIDELYITSIAVHPKHQRMGIGKFLLSDLIKRSNSLQTNHIYLEVKDTNKAGKAFYKSMDFKIAAIRSNFYKDGSNALIFTKTFKTNQKGNY